MYVHYRTSGLRTIALYFGEQRTELVHTLTFGRAAGSAPTENAPFVSEVNVHIPGCFCICG